MGSVIRRSSRLQQKAKSVPENGESAGKNAATRKLNIDSDSFVFEDESEDGSDPSETVMAALAVSATEKTVTVKKSKEKRKRTDANKLVEAPEAIITDGGQPETRTVKRKRKRKAINDNDNDDDDDDDEYIVRKTKQQKRWPKKKVINDGETSKNTIKSGNSKSSKKDAKLVKQSKQQQKRQISIASSSSELSEDEWEEMEEIGLTGETSHGTNPDVDSDNGTVEVTIKAAKPVETSESKWAKFIRQQVNRKIRERQVNCHKMHLLCYIAHLRQWIRTLLRDGTLTSLCLSLIPEGYIAAAQHGFDVATAERFLKWFRSAFQRAQTDYIVRNGFGDSQVEKLEKLIGDRVYESDKDLASTMNMIRTDCIEKFVNENIYNNDCLEVWERKLTDVTKKVIVKVVEEKHFNTANNDTDAKKTSNKISKKEKMVKNERSYDDTVVVGSSTNKPKSVKFRLERNYWVEYWDDNNGQWICMDPWCGTVDMPETVEAEVTDPMHYVICIDNHLGMRDITARYASKFLAPELRRLRTDPEWWTQTLKIYRSKNRKRERMEDVAIHDFLLSKPKPTTVAEYKNHPLYVLKKDILKYEAIYPENQPPVGQIRGVDIYPRSSVFHLDGSLNWMKKSRMIKAGEKPYKIVKGRVNPRIPPELREPKALELFGYWQTEPYIPPKVVNGRVPRNEFGNLYVYKNSMVPEGCVHVRLDGLLAVARKLDIDCVPAVVGWEFHKGGNHPILEGCVVLKEHEKALREAWREFYEKKQIAAEKKRHERALKNWRRLVKGMLTMRKVRDKFLVAADRRNMRIDEKLENDEGMKEEMKKTETPALDDTALAWPRTAFNLPGTSADGH